MNGFMWEGKRTLTYRPHQPITLTNAMQLAREIYNSVWFIDRTGQVDKPYVDADPNSWITYEVCKRETERWLSSNGIKASAAEIAGISFFVHGWVRHYNKDESNDAR